MDVTAIPGLAVTRGFTLVSELGADLSAWASGGGFVSWLGLSPTEQRRAGTIRRNTTKKVKHRASRGFRLAAQSAGRSKTVYFGAFYRRLQARIGAPNALTATARKMARLFSRMVSTRASYREAGEAA